MEMQGENLIIIHREGYDFFGEDGKLLPRPPAFVIERLDFGGVDGAVVNADIVD